MCRLIETTVGPIAIAWMLLGVFVHGAVLARVAVWVGRHMTTTDKLKATLLPHRIIGQLAGLFRQMTYGTAFEVERRRVAAVVRIWWLGFLWLCGLVIVGVASC